MREANIQTLFGKRLKELNYAGNRVFELKLCKKKAIPLDSVKKHQIEGLLQAKRGMYHKLVDNLNFSSSRGARPCSQKPFDCLWIKADEAYVAICWYVPRKPKYIHLITVEDWIELLKTHKRKSIREDEVEMISSKIKL